MRILVFVALFAYFLGANNLEYTLFKKGDDKNTMLVIGGIQGDEPGGFFAANILATEYEIKKGSLWVVPNLNFNSIIKNNRGIKGDMNRKFAKIAKNDPDFKVVTNIKEVITEPSVELIVHLHDGSGFYRQKFVNALENPKRWGNSSVIDQEVVSGVKYGNLLENSTKVIKAINAKIKDEKHKYHTKNTHTAQKGSSDAEQLNSLTYFAITKGKAAYANEASKELDIYTRIYYHLLALEEYMKIAGIEYKRGFELNTKEIKKIVEKELQINFFDDKILLSFDKPRGQINYIPTPTGKSLEKDYNASNALIAVVGEKEKNTQNINVYYGNRFLTKLKPQYFDYSASTIGANIKIDGKDEIVTFGSKIHADKTIEIVAKNGVRVNVIGYEKKNKFGKAELETGVKIKKDDMQRNFSIDKAGKIFRVEFYEQENGKKDKFLGMILVEFAFLDGVNTLAKLNF